MGKNVCLVLTLIRHGETDMNAKSPRIMQGQSDTPMNEVGKKQAEIIAWRLKKYRFDKIYSSDLQRCTNTAEEIRKHQPTAELIKDKRLREQDLGDLTGMPWTDAKKMLKKEDVHLDTHIEQKGGENKETFTNRVVGYYSELVEKHLVDPHSELMKSLQSLAVADTQPVENIKEKELTPVAVSNLKKPSLAGSNASLASSTDSLRLKPKLKTINILLVTHGGWIHTLTDHLTNELNFNLDTELHHGFPKNTGVYRFVISKIFTDDGDYEWEGAVNLINCVSHLAGFAKKLEEKPESYLASSTASPNDSPLPQRKIYAIGVGPKPSISSSLIKQVQTQLIPAVAPPGSRQKSLGW